MIRLATETAGASKKLILSEPPNCNANDSQGWLQSNPFNGNEKGLNTAGAQIQDQLQKSCHSILNQIRCAFQLLILLPN